jgi:uncharacterized membrane protein YeiH
MLGIAAAAMIASSVLAYQRGDKWLALLQAAVGLYVFYISGACCTIRLCNAIRVDNVLGCH